MVSASKWAYANDHMLSGAGYVCEPPPDSIGFVYKITNSLTGRAYIGKKLLQFKGTKQVKGKKKRTLVESDWRTYNGSNVELQNDIAALGETNFVFTILNLSRNLSFKFLSRSETRRSMGFNCYQFFRSGNLNSFTFHRDNPEGSKSGKDYLFPFR